MALSKTTQDHDEIREWAEARGAEPAEVKSTQRDGEPGILRFCFPDAANRNDANLRKISWEEFFEKFDENNLELLYQEETAEGAQSNFNKLIYPENEKKSERKSSGSGSKTSSSGRKEGGSDKPKTSQKTSPKKSSQTKSATKSSGKKTSGKKLSGTKSSGTKRSKAA